MTALALLALALGWFGFKQANPDFTCWTALYLALQLFALNVSAENVSWPVEIARFLAPAVVAYGAAVALVAILHERFRLVLAGFMRDHIVLCGLGAKGLHLVRSFHEHRMRVVAIERRADDPGIAECRELGAIVLIGSAADPFIMEKASVQRAMHFIAISGNDGDKVEAVINAYALWQKHNPRPKQSFRCHVHLGDRMLRDVFEKHPVFADPSDRFECSLFSLHDTVARMAFDEYPIEVRPDGRFASRVHLVIVGFGRIGESLALQAARIGHFSGAPPLKITVFERAAKRRHASFHNRYPQFGNICQIEFRQGGLEWPDFPDTAAIAAVVDDAAMTTIAFCLRDEGLNGAAALHLYPHIAGRPARLLVRSMLHSGIETLLKTPDLQALAAQIAFFGQFESSCTHDCIVNARQDLLAKAIHADYVRARRAERVPDNPSLRPWHLLAEDFRQSNRQQADHIPVKLRAIGCFSSSEPTAPGCEPVTEFTPEEVETLARMEHERWKAERFIAGWSLGPIKDPDRRISPHLIQWDDLPEDIQDYDRRAVRNIPRLLGLLKDAEKVYRGSPATKPHLPPST